MTIRIGANPIGWSNDDLQNIGAHISLATCLKQAQAIGFEGMELGHKFPRDAHALKTTLAPYNMACVGGWHSLSLLERDADEEFDAARSHRELLKAMGTSVFIAAETSNAIHGMQNVPLSKRPHLQGADWQKFGARITRLADLLKQEGWLDESVKGLPYERLVEPAEVARACLYLATDASGLMSGANIDFDQSVNGAYDNAARPQTAINPKHK